MGTSLQVTPFCDLPHAVGPACARLLLNFDVVGARGSRSVAQGQGFRFDSASEPHPHPTTHFTSVPLVMPRQSPAGSSWVSLR
jgi:hypothetical protein